ncbi:hypothetical protein [Pseudomonas viridiflava]|uniref:hypothetical protein n=1 Tax=Pseudomonas viridiflava TaxID=33069 RepID=UPI001C2DB9B0|nr:hypothetical protein [Pseudomonas viridiflava]MBV1809870.1 hypothetical protein [Pseudomonas viridiflava]
MQIDLLGSTMHAFTLNAYGKVTAEPGERGCIARYEMSACYSAKSKASVASDIASTFTAMV